MTVVCQQQINIVHVIHLHLALSEAVPNDRLTSDACEKSDACQFGRRAARKMTENVAFANQAFVSKPK